MDVAADGDFRQVLKDELSKLQAAAVAERETNVPMIAALHLPQEEDDVVEEIAHMHSHLSGSVPKQNCNKSF